jgi:hypothetical protein
MLIVHLVLRQGRGKQFESDLVGLALFALSDGLQGLDQFLIRMECQTRSRSVAKNA